MMLVTKVIVWQQISMELRKFKKEKEKRKKKRQKKKKKEGNGR